MSSSSLADYLSSPPCIKYRGLWDNALDQKDGPAIAALSREAFFGYVSRAQPPPDFAARFGEVQATMVSITQQGLLESGMQDPAARQAACSAASTRANLAVKTCLQNWQAGMVPNVKEFAEALLGARRYMQLLACNPSCLAACNETAASVNSKEVQIGTWLAALKRAGWNLAAVPCPVAGAMGASGDGMDAEMAALMADGMPAGGLPQQQQGIPAMQQQQQPSQLGFPAMQQQQPQGYAAPTQQPQQPQQSFPPMQSLQPQGFPAPTQQPQQPQQPQQGFPPMQSLQQHLPQQGFPPQPPPPQGFPSQQGGFLPMQPQQPIQQQPFQQPPPPPAHLPQQHLASNVPCGLGAWAEREPAVRASIGHAQQAIAALRTHNLAQAQAEVAACQRTFGQCVQRQVGQPMAALLSAPTPAAAQQAAAQAAMRLRLFIAAVRWQQSEHAIGYLGQVGV